MDIELLVDHPAPTAGGPLRIRALLKVSGRAPEREHRTPFSLALVLDRSGSMAGAKLVHAKEAAALLVRRLWPEDRVSVVSYDSEVEVLASATTGDAQAEAVQRIRALTPRGTTNLSGGWLEGRRLVEESRVEGGVNRVLLMTDGQANQGITSPDALRELARKAAEHDGITTTTIGFGRRFNEDLLQAMADAGGGASYYIENPDQAPGVFEEEVEGLLCLAAQNVAAEVRPEAGARLAVIRHAYPSHEIDGGVRVQMGDLYASEPRYLLMEFELEDAAAGEELAAASVRVRGHVLTKDGGVESRTVDLPLRLVVGEGPRVDPEVRKVATLLDAADARERARAIERDGRVSEAAELLVEVADRVRAAVPGDEELEREGEDLRTMASRMRRTGRLDAADVKYMKQRVYDDSRSRSLAKQRYWRE